MKGEMHYYLTDLQGTVLFPKPDKPVTEEQIACMTHEFEMNMLVLQNRFGGLSPQQEEAMRAIFNAKMTSMRDEREKIKTLTMSDHKVAADKDEAWNIQDTQAGKPHGWIQWKGTSVCMDIYCKCGEHSHVDADFAYHVKCPECGTVYFCNGHIELIELKKEPEGCVIEGEQH